MQAYKILYIEEKKMNYNFIKLLLKENLFDYIYLNSFFSVKFSLIPLLVYYINNITISKVILAPRGELDHGAMQYKKIKKTIYCFFFKMLGIHRKIEFHVTSISEKEKVIDLFGNHVLTNQISNLVSYVDYDMSLKPIKTKGKISLVFLSRIHPKKNLLLVLETLNKIKGKIEFSIYGPIEDLDYWDRCESVISKLPSDVIVTYKGTIAQNEVNDIFTKHHLFMFLTYGENFGHVIFESLISGCPVFISDQTPWSYIGGRNAGIVSNLKDLNQIVYDLQNFVMMNQNEYINYIENARKVAIDFLKNQTNEIKKYKRMFNND
jgi:glycosyltransferase involved in cell wall biosynthesis